MQPTADERILAIAGSPNERATHWGISRFEKGEWSRLEARNEHGIKALEWPLDELTLENVRGRWSSGDFKCHWFAMDPENPDPKKRRIAEGHSRQFGIESEPAKAPAAAAPVFAGPGDSMGSALQFATQLLDMSERRSAATIEAVTRLAGVGQHAPQPSGDPALAAEVASLKAHLEESERRRTLEEAHRAELARRDKELEAIRRRLDDAEDDDEPTISAEGGGFAAQIGAGIANAIVESAKKNPELVMGILGGVLAPLAQKLMGGDAQQHAPPQPQHVPRQMQRPQQQPQQPLEEVTANGMPSVPMPIVEKTKTGVEVVRANGAAAPATPAAPSSPAEVQP